MSSTMQEAPKRKSNSKRSSGSVSNGSRIPTHDDIAVRARELFEESGYQPGRDVEFWLEAERQLREVLKD